MKHPLLSKTVLLQVSIIVLAIVQMKFPEVYKLIVNNLTEFLVAYGTAGLVIRKFTTSPLASILSPIFKGVKK